MAELLALAHDIVTEGIVSHGSHTLYPSESGEQRFGTSSGLLEIRIANLENQRFSWLQLLRVLEDVERFLFEDRRYYKTWFEFWAPGKHSDSLALGRGKLFKV